MLDDMRDRHKHPLPHLQKHKRAWWDRPFFTLRGANKVFVKLAIMEIALAFIALVLTRALGLW